MGDVLKLPTLIKYLVSPEREYQNSAERYDRDTGPQSRTHEIGSLLAALQMTEGVKELVDGMPTGALIIPFAKVDDVYQTDTQLHGGDGIVIRVSSEFSAQKICDGLNTAFAYIGPVRLFNYATGETHGPSRPGSNAAASRGFPSCTT